MQYLDWPDMWIYNTEYNADRKNTEGEPTRQTQYIQIHWLDSITSLLNLLTFLHMTDDYSLVHKQIFLKLIYIYTLKAYNWKRP